MSITYHTPTVATFRRIAILALIIWITAGLTQSYGASEQKLRFILLSGLEEIKDATIIEPDGQGKWLEHGTVDLQANRLTEWLSARAGELNLAVKKEGEMETICQFTIPEDSGPVLVALVGKPGERTCAAHLVDFKKAKLDKGSLLIINLSERTGIVTQSKTEEKVEPGQQALVTSVLDANGMNHMQVSQMDEAGNIKPCFDRFVSVDPNSRRIMFLLTDSNIGIRVTLSSIRGELE
jgi:hypothetical protein